MTSARNPLVVLIDDETEKVDALARDLGKRVDVAPTTPDALDEATLRAGTIFLVDMFLDVWPERVNLAPAAQVFDGIALAGVIRAYTRHHGLPMPVVALNTGQPDGFSELPLEIREHAIARAHNLEWVFLKSGSLSQVPTHERVLSLADAQSRLPTKWTTQTGETDLLRVLDGLDDELPEILDAWPPIREVGEDSGGIAVLRWLLHRILPYPTFLLDQRHVAARLGITTASLATLRTSDTELGRAVANCQYAGVLSDFDGPRWWRGRIESMLWNLSPNGALPATPEDVLAASTVDLEAASSPRGVVVLNADYTPRPEPVDASQAVRIALDDWPPYAEQAWASIADAREDHRLRERVLPLDRVRLGS